MRTKQRAPREEPTTDLDEVKRLHQRHHSESRSSKHLELREWVLGLENQLQSRETASIKCVKEGLRLRLAELRPATVEKESTLLVTCRSPSSVSAYARAVVLCGVLGHCVDVVLGCSAALQGSGAYDVRRVDDLVCREPRMR